MGRGIGFRVGVHRFILYVEQVREVIDVPLISRMPGVKPWVLGLASLRGTLLPIIDLLAFLSREPTSVGAGSRILVIEGSEGPSGLLVDEIFGLKRVDQGVHRVEPNADQVSLDPYVKEYVRVENENWGLFDIDALSNVSACMVVTRGQPTT